MKGWKKVSNKGATGARKKQTAHGDHSVSRVKQKRGPEAKSSSMGFAGNKIQGLGDKRPPRDNIVGPMKGN